MNLLKTAVRRVFSRENVFALLICLVAVFLIIVTADAATQWIYQGF
ncbi:MAG: hypothetical protein JW910_16110 [Anaerolineae bacterium]|nr:hypothetical protein [Anaerolineae bacterium]